MVRFSLLIEMLWKKKTKPNKLLSGAIYNFVGGQ